MGFKHSKFSQDESMLFKHINPSSLVEDVKNGKITMIIENCLPDIVIGRVVQVYDDDTFTMITVNNLHSTLSFTPYHVRITDAPVFIKNSLRHLILNNMVKVENISIDVDGALLCKVSQYNWTCENDVTKLHSSHGADGILYMQEKYREYGHNIPHIT
jgi:hypothetical protein